MSAVNRIKSALSIQTASERVSANANNEALLEEIVREIQYRMSQQGFKGDKRPLPFLRCSHDASPEYLRELRCCLGLTQAKMSRLLKVGSDVISRYEAFKDTLGRPAQKRLVAIGMKYAADGIRPDVPEELYSGGLSDTEEPRLKGSQFKRSSARERVKTLEALKDPKFAIKEVGIGFLAGMAGVGTLLMLAGAGLVLLAGALAR